MAKYKCTAYMCGHKSAREDINCEALTLPGWESLSMPSPLMKEYKKFYYPEFVDFCHGPQSGACRHFRREGKNFGELNLYVMPCAIILYSIKVEMKCDDLNDYTAFMSGLRTKTDGLGDIAPEMTEVLQKLCSEPGNLDFGNKLKVFHIINRIEGEGAFDPHLLFELGALSRVGSHDASDGFSDEYITRTLSQNRLKIYNNWEALSLLDTFTILADNASPRLVQEAWVDDYYSMIYIHSLFIKFYLFRLNVKFREHPELANRLEDEFQVVEQDYSFSRISYNFLPQQVMESMRRGLEIPVEKAQLAQAIAATSRKDREYSDRRMNAVLVFLTIITVFSTLLDLSNLVEKLSQSWHTVFSVATVCSTTLLALSLLWLLWRYRRK